MKKEKKRNFFWNGWIIGVYVFLAIMITFAIMDELYGYNIDGDCFDKEGNKIQDLVCDVPVHPYPMWVVGASGAIIVLLMFGFLGSMFRNLED